MKSAEISNRQVAVVIAVMIVTCFACPIYGDFYSDLHKMNEDQKVQVMVGFLKSKTSSFQNWAFAAISRAGSAAWKRSPGRSNRAISAKAYDLHVAKLSTPFGITRRGDRKSVV